MQYKVNRPNVINETIEGETVMIHLGTGSYYSLDPVGTDVWERLDRCGDVSAVVAGLVATYDPADGDIAADVEAFCRELEADELIVPASEAPGVDDALPNGSGGTRPWSRPRLERFTDMQDLILLDPVHEVDERGWPHPLDAPAGES